jgi:hypothetical protein
MKPADEGQRQEPGDSRKADDSTGDFLPAAVLQHPHRQEEEKGEIQEV